MGVEADGALRYTVHDHFVHADERAGEDEEDVGGIDGEDFAFTSTAAGVRAAGGGGARAGEAGGGASFGFGLDLEGGAFDDFEEGLLDTLWRGGVR